MRASLKKRRARPIEVKRNEWLQWRYGITHAQYDQMLLEQKGCCKICCKEFSPERKPQVDHKHGITPTLVRGLLCKKCNTLIGFADESPEILDRAKLYLGFHGPDLACLANT